VFSAFKKPAYYFPLSKSSRLIISNPPGFHFIYLQEMTTHIVLTTNKTTAELTGIQHFPCRFQTSLCPDRCGHAHDAATFKILSYEVYEKPGREGDDKQSTFYARLDSNEKSRTDYQTPEIVAKIKELKPGQKVKLFWEHIYVTDTETGSKWPERPIRSIEVI
jgi:hypothetical protein